MFALMLLAISTVALSQFGVFYWRAVLASVASQPVSMSVLSAVSAENRPLRAADFGQFVGLHQLTPDLTTRGQGLGLVRFYYSLVQALEMLVGQRVPAVAQWTEREGATCARYAAVRVDLLLQGNLEASAAIRSC
jgi:hypothetical protein